MGGGGRVGAAPAHLLVVRPHVHAPVVLLRGRRRRVLVQLRPAPRQGPHQHARHGLGLRNGVVVREVQDEAMWREESPTAKKMRALAGRCCPVKMTSLAWIDARARAAPPSSRVRARNRSASKPSRHPIASRHIYHAGTPMDAGRDRMRHLLGPGGHGFGPLDVVSGTKKLQAAYGNNFATNYFCHSIS